MIRLAAMLLLAILVGGLRPANGQEVNGIYTESTTKDLGERTKIDFLKNIKFRGWVEGSYIWNFNKVNPDVANSHQPFSAIRDHNLTIEGQAFHTHDNNFTLDLAEEWICHTGKPFVFAFWAVREKALREAEPVPDLAGIFQQSRDRGLEPASLNQIAREWSPRVGISEADVHTTLASAPAPRIVLVHGGVVGVYLLMESFAKFLVGMGYPEAKIRDPRDGAYSQNPYGSSERLASSPGATNWGIGKV